MSLLGVLNGPWAIAPEKLQEIQAIYAAHVRGDQVDLAAIEARIGRPLANEQGSYEVVEGVAVLPISGVIFPKANLMTQISGGASAQLLMRQVQAAGDDPKVRGLILSIDSPGGNVLGTPELAQAVRQVAAIKPTVTHSDGMLASAAYWIGSAANAIYVSGPTVEVGSIGVVMTHRDVSAAEQKAGVRTTHITAGRYKRMGHSSAALDTESEAYLQSRVDHVFSVFVDALSENLGVSVEAMLEHAADGRLFIGQQAIDAGLVDGVSTLDALIEQMASDPSKFAKRRRARVGGGISTTSSHSASLAMSTQQTLTAAEMAARARAHAKKEGISFVTAFNALGYTTQQAAEATFRAREEEPSVVAAPADSRGEQDAVAVRAYVKQHGVDAGSAYRALGFLERDKAAATAARDAAGQRDKEVVSLARDYAAAHKVSFSKAAKALGFVS